MKKKLLAGLLIGLFIFAMAGMADAETNAEEHMCCDFKKRITLAICLASDCSRNCEGIFCSGCLKMFDTIEIMDKQFEEKCGQYDIKKCNTDFEALLMRCYFR